MKTLFVVAVLGACGGGHTAPAHPDHPAATPVVDAAPAPVAASPSAAECDQLLDHAIAVSAPADHKLTEDEQAQIRAKLHDEFTAQCLALPRATYTCALAAPSMQELAGCDQRTPSSSTSNSSVAPGGITPPAPRSP